LITKGERLLARLDDNTPAERTIQANVSAFVSFKRSQAEAGERSLDRADSLRVHLNEHFAKWIAPETPVTDINEATVSDYYQHILSLAKEGKVSRYYARDLFASFRQFVRWVANRRLIPLPLNLASRDFGFKLTGNIQTFENAEVTALLNAASGRTKLYLLLMLNCGFTQADIAELGQSEIDLKRGTLAHKRTKTEEHESVPTVAYGLWKETKALLVEYLNRTCKATNRHGDCLALVNENGNGLLRKRYDEKGKLKKQDDIRSAYNRVVAKLNRKRKAGDRINKTLKHFRKTASSKLEEHPTYGRYVVHFLGQSPESVAGKFYVSPSQKQFDEAVKWLRGQFTF
jgi:integrase